MPSTGNFSEKDSGLDFAWAVGLFEGEGCIQCRQYWAKRKSGARLEYAYLLSLSSTDLDVVQRFHSIVGVGSLHGPRIIAGKKPIWRWTCSGWDRGATLLTQMLPLLGIRRRAKAEEYLSTKPRLPHHKLTWDQVEEVRNLSSTMSRKDLSSMYGISLSHLSNLINGRVRSRATAVKGANGA